MPFIVYDFSDVSLNFLNKAFERKCETTLLKTCCI